ncbi:MAG: YdbH domain-containing protein [Pseudomonas sp.]|uniref:intermembrane phospholipid transport protein YdbH family protein n=1 Tax=Pseudomonas sp. TaxID=306 RepID=UPI0033951B0D
MTPTRRRWRLAGFLSLLGLAALGYALSSLQRVLDRHGLDVRWQGLALSRESVRLERLDLVQQGVDGQLQIHGQGLSWNWRGEDTRHLAIQILQVQWYPSGSSQPTTAAPPRLDPATLLAELTDLPRRSHIDQLTLELPCPAGRCTLSGSLDLEQVLETGGPLDLRLALRRDAQLLQLDAQLRGQPDALNAELRLTVDNQMRLTLLSSLTRDPQGTEWKGQLAVPRQLTAAWPTAWAGDWLSSLPALLASAPADLQITADWQLRLPAGPLGLADLMTASGQLNFAAQLPSAWQVPQVGRLQGTLELGLLGETNAWRLQRVQADLQLAQPEGNWLQPLPMQFRPDTLSLRIQDTGAVADTGTALPLRVALKSRGRLNLDAQADLALANAAPLALTLNKGQLEVQAAQLDLGATQLQQLRIQLPLSGTLGRDGLNLALGQGAQVTLTRASAGSLMAEGLQAQLDGLKLTAALNPMGLSTASLQGTLDLRIKKLSHPRLKPQDWQWQGQLLSDLQRTEVKGQLSGGSGLKLDLELLAEASGAVQLKTALHEVFLRAGNSLAATFSDWPALLQLDAGRLRGNAQLHVPGPGGVPQAELSVELQGVAGLYDSTALQGLSGQLQVALSAGRLQVKVPTLTLQQADPGFALGPLQLQGEYAAAQDALGKGQLKLQQAHLQVLGGILSLPPTVADLAQQDLQLPLQVQGLELQRLLEAYPTEGLAGHGTLDGQLPLVVGPAGVTVRQGHLLARAPGGVLQFNSPRIRALGQANPGMKLVADALADFHYQRLSSDVDYDQQGKLRLALRVEGSNPALENGRPINLSINLEEDIPMLLASLQLTGKVSERIRQRVQERLGQPKATP